MYRFEERLWSNGSHDMNGEFVPSPYGPTVTLECREIKVLSETPCGHWVEDDRHFHGKRWVSKTTTKAWCKPTKQEAADSFIARKNRQIKILKAQQRIAEQALNIAKDWTDD